MKVAGCRAALYLEHYVRHGCCDVMNKLWITFLLNVLNVLYFSTFLRFLTFFIFLERFYIYALNRVVSENRCHYPKLAKLIQT